MVLIIVACLLGLILLFVLSLLLSQIRIEINLNYTNNYKNLFVKVKFLRLMTFKKNFTLEEEAILQSFEEQKTTTESKSIDFKQMKSLDTLKDLVPYIKALLQSIHVDKLNWHSMIGLTSADQTAVVTGWLYSVKSLISTSVTQVMNNQTIPVYSIQPNYQQATYQTELECILSFKFGQIMRELLGILRYLRKGGS
ncbi:hypothetical protein [Aquisalibacillus elongatus]|uniref:DUF2953 family protein n=1 Tax=Aquisalibacillus elongatus TaxID=485577 RepID=A0A3N5BZU7_9BACI|nr:hypothetical protein [Aquisalibacillus elongatus]RPF55348.1 hypothetical protein EDC24_0219 [Aquisalibacillus elongatus]